MTIVAINNSKAINAKASTSVATPMQRNRIPKTRHGPPQMHYFLNITICSARLAFLAAFNSELILAFIFWGKTVNFL